METLNCFERTKERKDKKINTIYIIMYIYTSYVSNKQNLLKIKSIYGNCIWVHMNWILEM